MTAILKSAPISADKLAALAENKQCEKYDGFLPDSLLCSEFAARMLDMDGALGTIEALVAK